MDGKRRAHKTGSELAERLEGFGMTATVKGVKGTKARRMDGLVSRSRISKDGGGISTEWREWDGHS